MSDREPITHELKTHPEPFADVREGRKTFEVRLNDRDYRVGDDLLLREWVEDAYTGQEDAREIVHILDLGFWIPGCPAGWVVLGMVEL